MANPTGISYTHSESHSRKVTVSHLVKPSAAAPILLPAPQVERLSMHVQEVALIRHARSNTLGGLVFVCWEALVTHDNEVQFIWSKPNTSFIKWLFLYIRYAGILGQIFNVFVTTQYPLSSAQCVYWFTVKCVIGQAMMSAFETVLILRVYALYGRSYRVAAAMLFFILAEITITSTAVWHMMPTLDFGPTCFTVLPHKATTYYMAGALSTQLAIVTLTLHKSSATSLSMSRWSNNALSTIIKRDGTAACGTVFVLILAVMIHVVLEDTLILALVVYWFFPLLSVGGCRLVLNTQDVALPHAYSDHDCDTEPELTSIRTTAI
ncbi:hypothetical protein FIBSPDRAFT_1038390 [Athelia psychrophila]|uniref:DUF6533 domain-containing protein n=1 Tax=Athelia psychrophila TaxID=1759441 RepID=A0A166SZQ4_9AGAM|nr:hypothetical protein FIBSPDRAFT_1038390 [Fibularhizoctonia sp. CBS 109695]